MVHKLLISSGWGTYSHNKIIYAALAGHVKTISKLVTVSPLNSPYRPEIGHVVIARIIAVDKKSWRVNMNGLRDGVLNLAAINLPQGEQRRRSEEDSLQMRKHFTENDLLSGEVQQIFNDGSINIHTRNLKYGKVLII